jgi:phosphoglycolate phosphatase
MRFTTVLFDLDGTLTDSQSGIIASYRHTLSLLGLEATDGEIRRCIGPPLAVSLRQLGVDVGDIERATDIYRGYFAEKGIFDNRLYPGVTELLDALTARGLVLAIATSKLDEFAVGIAEHFGMAQYFTAVAGATRDGTRLHKEDIAEYALVQLGSPDRARVAMVGDREHDMFAATALGIYPIGATWGYGSPDELTSAGAVELVESVPLLSQLLLGGA